MDQRRGESHANAIFTDARNARYGLESREVVDYGLTLLVSGKICITLGQNVRMKIHVLPLYPALLSASQIYNEIHQPVMSSLVKEAVNKAVYTAKAQTVWTF